MIQSYIQKNQRILPKKKKKKENLLELRNEFIKLVVVVQLPSCIQIFVTP